MSGNDRNQILSWLNESDEVDNLSNKSGAVRGNISDSDGPTEDGGHDSNSEQSEYEEEPTNPATVPHEEEINNIQTVSGQRLANVSRQGPYLLGRDLTTKWNVHEPTLSRTPRQNIIKTLPGVKAVARNAKTAYESWKLFFPDNLVDDIVRFTNEQLTLMSQNYANCAKDCPQTDCLEIQAFLGVLYLAGVKKANHLNLDELWADDGSAPEFFVVTMSKKRFQTLIQAIRFDEKSTRPERLAKDNIAPIRKVFEIFVQKCQETYNVGELVTLDEMLEAFRGRCKFRQYIANKPAKYGIKIYALVDARTFFTNNLEIYPGKQPQGEFHVSNDVVSVVKRLTKPIDKSGRNITIDNFFMNIPLANDLYVNHRLTVVGTVRKNKPQLPLELTTNLRERPVNSTLFAFSRDPNHCMVASYIPKKGKNVLVGSTMHKQGLIDEESGDQLKPELITFYNLTKGGVDVVDRMKTEYCVTRVSNRWPLTVFCSLLNIGAINGQIILKANTDTLIPRRKYLSELARELALPHMTRRSSLTNLSVTLRQKIRYVAKIKDPEPRQDDEPKIRCAYCPLRKNRFTQARCGTCRHAVCKEHTATTVITCFQCREPENQQGQE